MNHQRDLDRIVSTWLEEGPTDLPDATRRAIVSAVPTTSQARRGLLAPRRFPMPTLARAALPALLVLAAVGGAIYILGTRTPLPVTPSQSPSPSSVSTIAPGSTPVVVVAKTASPQDGRVDPFARPFSYHLPANSGIIVGESEYGFWQFRVPAPGVSDIYAKGFVVRAERAGHEDPCNQDSPLVQFAPGAQSVMDYLATVPTTELRDVHSIEIDGLPALAATLHLGPATATCQDLWLWGGIGSITQNGGHDTDVAMRVVDVNGEHIVIFGVADAAWAATVDEIIATINFDGAGN